MAFSVPDTVAEAIVAAGRSLDRHGWVPATAGNISIRLAPDRIAITRSGRHKGQLVPADVMLVDAAGAPLIAGERPSYETGCIAAFIAASRKPVRCCMGIPSPIRCCPAGMMRPCLWLAMNS